MNKKLDFIGLSDGTHTFKMLPSVHHTTTQLKVKYSSDTSTYIKTYMYGLLDGVFGMGVVPSSISTFIDKYLTNSGYWGNDDGYVVGLNDSSQKPEYYVEDDNSLMAYVDDEHYELFGDGREKHYDIRWIDLDNTLLNPLGASIQFDKRLVQITDSYELPSYNFIKVVVDNPKNPFIEMNNLTEMENLLVEMVGEDNIYDMAVDDQLNKYKSLKPNPNITEILKMSNEYKR